MATGSKTRSLAGAAILVLSMVAGASVQAEELAFESLPPCDEATLDAQRGGFVLSGMTFSLGAEMRTYLDGELALSTTVNWRDGDMQTSRWVSAALTPATAEQLQSGFIDSGALQLRVGNQPVFLANSGQTALLQRTDGGIQNILLNTASATSIRQETDLTLEVSGYQAFGETIGRGAVAGSLGDTIARSSLNALRF